jgi:nitroreductase
VDICQSEALKLENGKAYVAKEKCIHCAGCVAICPEHAVIVEDMHNTGLNGASEGRQTEELFDIIRNRRSCRAYTTEQVSRKDLENLVTFGLWAPSGTNSQKWTFTIIPDRKSVIAFADSVAEFYRKLNRQAANPLYRFISMLFARDILGRYYKRYYRQVKKSIEKWDQKKDDKLFHGATAAIVIASAKDASCPAADAHMAAQNIILGAQTMNLGSCLIGFAVEAIKRDIKIPRSIGIKDEETVYSVIAIGHPKYKFIRPSGRRPVIPRYFQSFK